MGYFYNQRILVVPVAGFEEDFKRLKDMIDQCLENEDFSELEEIMELEYYNASIDASEDVFVETTDDYCQFFINADNAGEGFSSDAIGALAHEFNVCVYHAFSEKDDDHDGAGVGIYFIKSVDEYDEVECGHMFCIIDENRINDGTWYSEDRKGKLPYEPGSEKMETILIRIGHLAWDYGYDYDNDPDYHYESSCDALKCFKQILSDLNMLTENPKIEL